MKKRLWIPFLFCSSLLLASERGKILSIVDFKGGLDSNYSSLTIADNEVQRCLNVYFSKNNAVTKRNGFTLFGSTTSSTITGAWQFTDSGALPWMIVRTSTVIYATNGTGTFSTIIATVPAGSVVNEVNAQGKAFFVDNVDGVFWWNGSTTTQASGSPKGTAIAEFHGRVVVCGVATPNDNVAYLSKYLDGTSWTESSIVSDAAHYVVGLNDAGDPTVGMFSGLNDTLYVFKTLSIWGLYGFDQSDFTTRILTRDAGCIDQGSIQPYQGNILFMSRRGLEKFDGSVTRRISDKVKNLIDPATLNSFSQHSWLQTTAADFAAGDLDSVSLSTLTIDGALTNRTTDYPQNSAAVWGTGTYGLLPEGSQDVTNQFRYYDFLTNPGVLQTTFPDEFAGSQLRDGTSGTQTVWASASGITYTPPTVLSGMAKFSCNLVASRDPNMMRTTNPNSVGLIENPMKGTTFYMRIDHVINGSTSPYIEMRLSNQTVAPLTSVPSNNYFMARLATGNDNKLLLDRIESKNTSTSTTGGYSIAHSPNNNWMTPPVDFFMYVDTVSFRITLVSTTTPLSVTYLPVGIGETYSPMGVTSTGTAVYLISNGTGSTTGTAPNDTNFYVDRFGISPQRIVYTSSATGNVFDTGITAPNWDTFTANYSTNSANNAGDMTFFTQVSADGTNFDSFVAATSGTVVASNKKRYIDAKAVFKTNYASAGISLASMDIAAYSTGTFKSAIHNASAISSWNVFAANKADNSGTHSFFVRADTWSFPVTSTSPAWASVVPGGLPSSSTGPYFQVRDDLAATTGRNGPMQLQDFTVGWGEGTARPSMASIINDDRYWLSLATSSADSGNDAILVMNHVDSPIFTLFDIHAGSLVNYKNQFYHGDADATGRIYLDGQGYNDNGKAINAFIQTKDYSSEGTIYDKQYQDFYLQADALGAYNISTSYNLDRSTTTFAMDTVLQNEQPGFISVDLPFGEDNQRQTIGRTISFTIGNSFVDQPLTLYGGILSYRLKDDTRNLGK